LPLRKASPADIPVIHSLAERIWIKHYIPIIGEQQVNYMLGKMYAAETLRDQITKGSPQFYMVENENEAIAFISWENKNASEAFIHKFYVLNDKQRKGVGMNAFNDLLLEFPDTKTIRLQVNRMNYTAVNFYFKCGFTIESVADFDIGRGYFMNDFIMLWKKPEVPNQ